MCWSLDYEAEALKPKPPPATPSSPETENDKELDRLIAALLDAKRWLLESEGYTEDHREFCRERFSNARSALVALYNRQRKEIKGLQTMIDALQTSHRADTASLSSQLERLTGTVNGIALLFGIETTSNDVVVDTVRAELERLKAEQIAPEEAQEILEDLAPRHEMECSHWKIPDREDTPEIDQGCDCTRKPFYEKLRNLAAPRLRSLSDQKEGKE